MQIIHVLYIIPCAHKNKENLKTNTYTYINIAIIFYCSFVQLTKHNVRWRCSSWSSLTNLHNYFQQICISLILIKMQEKKGNNFNEWNGYGWKNCEYIKMFNCIVLGWRSLFFAQHFHSYYISQENLKIYHYFISLVIMRYSVVCLVNLFPLFLRLSAQIRAEQRTTYMYNKHSFEYKSKFNVV